MSHLRYLTIAGGAILFFCLQTVAQDIGSSIVSGYSERKDKAIVALKAFNNQDTARVNALIHVLSAAFIQKQRQELLPYCEEAMTLSRSLHFPAGLARCYIYKGYLAKGVTDRTSAHLYFDSAIQLGKSPVDDDLKRHAADGHRGKAWIYYEQENYYKALNHFFEALKYYEGKNRTTEMNLYTIIANIYSRVNNFDQAIIYAGKNAALAESDADHVMKAQAYLSLAEIFVRKDDLVSATIYLDRMAPFMPDPVQVMLNAGYYMNRGLVQYRKQQHDSAIFYYRQAYLIASASRHNANKTAALYYLSKSALNSGKLDLARQYADTNLAVSIKTGAKIGKINALLNLSDYNREINNNAKAYELLQQATALKDSLLMDANINQINTLAAVYEADKKEKDILQLQNEKAMQSVEVRQKATLNKIFIASLVVLLFFGYLGFINNKKAQQIARQEQLLQKQKITELEKNKQLASIDAMLKGQEVERSRIAKDLHDGLGSLLSGTKLAFTSVKDNLPLSADNTKQFDRALTMLDNTIGDLRKVAQNLMPEALVKFGLQEALSDFCDMIESSSGIKMIFHRFGEKRILDSTAEVFIYRIIQELVNNAVKHADATEVVIQLTMNEHKTEITVEDNGKGFDKNSLFEARGAGMTNIGYRVQYFNGTSDILSSPGNGTSVNIQLSV